MSASVDALGLVAQRAPWWTCFHQYRNTTDRP